MKKILMFALLLPLCAMAEEGGSSSAGSDFFAQKDAGASKLEFKLFNQKDSVEFTSGTKTEITSNVLSAEYERGLNEMFSLAAGLSYVTGEVDTTGSSVTDLTGLSDLDIILRGRSAMSWGSLKFGAVLGYSYGDKEIEANGDTNNLSGGTEISPYIGFEKNWDKCVFGGKLSQGIELAKKTVDNNGTEQENEGGEATELNLFYEHTLNEKALLGFSLSYLTVADSIEDGTTLEALSPYMGLGIYVPINLGHGVLKPELKYSVSNDDETQGQDLDSATSVAMGVGYTLDF